MNILFFMPVSILIAGFIVGLIFGFLLRKAYVTKFDVIVNQLRLKDFTVMKVILTANFVGAIGMYNIIMFMPQYQLLIANTTLLSAAAGGAIFGIGMAIMGYCPGTGIATLADGARDMLFGLAGMIVGAALYAQYHPVIAAALKPESELNRMTLPELFGISPWILIAAIGLMLFAVAKYDK